MTCPWPVRGGTRPELDRFLFEIEIEIEFFPQAFAPDVLAANERSQEQRMAWLGMICSIDDATVNPGNSGQPGASDYRNLMTAGVLTTQGFVQRVGFGIAQARRALADNFNSPPEFDVQPTMVMAKAHGADLILAADMYSLQGLRNMGPALRDWRVEWRQRVDSWAAPAFDLSNGAMAPLGDVLMQHVERLSRTAKVLVHGLYRHPVPARR